MYHKTFILSLNITLDCERSTICGDHPLEIFCSCNTRTLSSLRNIWKNISRDIFLIILFYYPRLFNYNSKCLSIHCVKTLFKNWKEALWNRDEIPKLKENIKGRRTLNRIDWLPPLEIYGCARVKWGMKKGMEYRQDCEWKVGLQKPTVDANVSK